MKSVEANNLGFIGEANQSEWPVTIKKIQNKFGKPNYIVPGHQHWSSDQALEHTLKLLQSAKD